MCLHLQFNILWHTKDFQGIWKPLKIIGLKFVRNGDMKLAGFIDVDWACDLGDRQSISAYYINLGDTLIS